MGLSNLIDDKKVVLLDGAMGTQLAALGSENPGGQDNLLNPDMVLSVHTAYATCGCDMLTTNTLTMNRIFIEHAKLGIDVREVNTAGVRLARQVIGYERLLLGDMSSTGQLAEPYGSYTLAQFSEAFEEQAAVLAEAGVDGFIVETMYDIREAVCAVKACRKVARRLPVLATVSFATTADGGKTMMGNSVEECVKGLSKAGATAIGANCGNVDPVETAGIIKEMSSLTKLPLIAQPNAGKPRLEGGRTVFDMSPSVFASGVMECIRNGAKIVGGCCGTSPEHISQLAQRMMGA